MSEIKVGQIWEVTSDSFYATMKNRNGMENRPERKPVLRLLKGEKIEIRFPFAWNYRTIDDIYLSSDEDYILENCKLFGSVDAKIKSNNKAKLEEIIRLQLYNTIDNL